MKTDRRFLTKAQNKTMKTIITSNSRPLLRPLCTILLGIAALWAMPGNARAQVLYVSQGSPGIVGEYDATTGDAINANFITGLSGPGDLALSGNNLFVTTFYSPTVSEYDATTGEAINASFITGLNEPSGLALSGNNLFVVNYGSDTVGEYNATTGAAINANFITGLNLPNGLAVATVPSCSPSPRGKQNLGFQRKLRFFNKPICHPN
jgi:hypothetical protein